MKNLFKVIKTMKDDDILPDPAISTQILFKLRHQSDEDMVFYNTFTISAFLNRCKVWNLKGSMNFFYKDFEFYLEIVNTIKGQKH